jgi:elongation factor 3
MWLNPHVLILDEPTNYLDRAGLGALTAGLQDYGGGVVVISHNEEFCRTIATETWKMSAGKLTREGQLPEEQADNADNNAHNTLLHSEAYVDAMGNRVEVDGKHRNVNVKELKRQIKELESKLKVDKKRATPELTEAFKWEMQDRSVSCSSS